MIQFSIPRKAVSWNTFHGRSHWTKRVQLKGEWTWETRAAFRDCPDKDATLVFPLEIEIDSYAKRPIDADNNASGKFIIDTLKSLLGIDDDHIHIRSVKFRTFKSVTDFIRVTIYDNSRTDQDRKRDQERKLQEAASGEDGEKPRSRKKNAGEKAEKILPKKQRKDLK